MQRLETKPSSLSIFAGLRESIVPHIEKVDAAATEAGNAIRQQIGDKVSSFKEGIIPDKLDFKDITAHTGEIPTTRYIVRYSRQDNQSFIVARRIGRIEDFFMSPFENEPPVYVHLSQDEQSERVIRPLIPAEWVKYAPPLIDKLEEAVVQKIQS